MGLLVFLLFWCKTAPWDESHLPDVAVEETRFSCLELHLTSGTILCKLPPTQLGLIWYYQLFIFSSRKVLKLILYIILQNKFLYFRTHLSREKILSIVLLFLMLTRGTFRIPIQNQGMILPFAFDCLNTKL